MNRLNALKLKKIRWSHRNSLLDPEYRVKSLKRRSTIDENDGTIEVFDDTEIFPGI